MTGEIPKPPVAGDDHRPVVLLFRPLFPAFQEALSERFHLLKAWESPEPFESFIVPHADSVRALVCSGPTVVDARIVALLPKLKLVVATSVGINHIDVDLCRQRGIAITNAGEINADDSADYAVGLLINALRRISAADRYVRRGLWPVNGEFPLSSKLGGKRIGIVGLGNIGSRIAKRLEAFGCTIFYHSRTKKPHVVYNYFSNVFDLATASDVLVLCCTLSDETHHIVNKDVLSALGKEGVVINVGRGPLIDEKELVRCLVDGEIGGAGLDVFENEPAVPEEFFTMDNVVLSHHRAVFTPDFFSSLLQLVIDNLEAFFSNKPLISPVFK